MMKLYESFIELETTYLKVSEVLNGEITEDAAGVPISEDDALQWLEECLQRIEAEQSEKAIRIGCFIKSLRAESEALKAEKLKLARRQASCEKTADRLKTYLETFLDKSVKIKDARCVLSWRRSEGVVVDVPATVLPEDCRRVKVEADLTAIKRKLKDGDEVPGARLEERMGLVVS